MGDLDLDVINLSALFILCYYPRIGDDAAVERYHEPQDWLRE